MEKNDRIEAPAIAASRPRLASECILPLEQELARATCGAVRPLMNAQCGLHNKRFAF